MSNQQDLTKTVPKHAEACGALTESDPTNLSLSTFSIPWIKQGRISANPNHSLRVQHKSLFKDPTSSEHLIEDRKHDLEKDKHFSEYHRRKQLNSCFDDSLPQVSLSPAKPETDLKRSNLELENLDENSKHVLKNWSQKLNPSQSQTRLLRHVDSASRSIGRRLSAKQPRPKSREVDQKGTNPRNRFETQATF